MPYIRDQIRTAMTKDGVDHINVSVYAETDVGKIASPDWRKNFFVPHVGDFISARSFANWLVSGGREDLRHSTTFYRTAVPNQDFRLLILFAKYYQLCSMRSNLVSAKASLALPWVMYKKHISGIREFDRWENYTQQVKPMIDFIIANGVKATYDWGGKTAIIECLDFYLEKITGADFIPFEELTRLAKEKPAPKERVDKAPSKLKSPLAAAKTPAYYGLPVLDDDEPAPAVLSMYDGLPTDDKESSLALALPEVNPDVPVRFAAPAVACSEPSLEASS